MFIKIVQEAIPLYLEIVRDVALVVIILVLTQVSTEKRFPGLRTISSDLSILRKQGFLIHNVKDIGSEAIFFFRRQILNKFILKYEVCKNIFYIFI